MAVFTYIAEIRKIADSHGALIIEDAAESLGATYNGVQTGCFGDYSIVSFNGNNVVTTSRFLIDRGVTTVLMHRRTNYAA